MHIAIPKESNPLESRVAATPASVQQLIQMGFSVSIENNAGAAAKFPDNQYETAGAILESDRAKLLANANIILKVEAPSTDELNHIKPNTTLICFISPAQNEDYLATLADKQINTLAIDCVPRISRAQKLDVLSSMANIAGYRAVIEAAHNFGRFFTGQITAAGKIPPAKILVIGAGVAGLAAVGTAKSMGAIVKAFDTRPIVKEQVESLGGEFLTVEIEEDGSGGGGYAKEMSQAFIDAEMALFREQAKDVDIVITTALIPGKPAPKLWLADMVETMKEGSVIVDLASQQGGNCELTEPEKKVVKHGVTIIGYTNLPSLSPTQSSTLYATNLVHLLSELSPEKDGTININFDDEVIRATTVVKEGNITWPPPPIQPTAPPPVTAQPQAKPSTAVPPQPATNKDQDKKTSTKQLIAFWLVAGLCLLGIGKSAPPEFVTHFTVFILSIFIGWQVIWNVSHSLHTPLMSVTNAISGIIVIGALLQITGSGSGVVTFLAFVAVLIATINIAGGFFVTHRMLKMFRK
ncbi:Re/Si-specific NAD(P)(+) transhydrogenase subunit alpha [Endozoicomonas sp. SM1973]|uniref:NAD(P) transhydrogenase subunit alpha n=1 Tax=Spartinivicinus marinus TaxID=2994442 RepID=A0A853IF04_9GAMM|nr:Re/Si-specific NAD(P)(+) transhydrogenase subunit alpha [Spartinivicinus marinus]MCX4029125.1 Re/Si-specific NAD(P)(+) transhydrogenase subunit alpha [Spartinivicinus marinus]NYZ67745.1 Re/Si-specific NAD(P)(+) transhydrogenase subunit alpha [Spartinivicinus marinus]